MWIQDDDRGLGPSTNEERIASRTVSNLEMPEVEWSRDQTEGIDRLLELIAPDPEAGQVHTMGLTGYAGTGKTTILRAVAHRALTEGLVNCVVFQAPTGKAAARLREKGCHYAHTIHSALYEPPFERKNKDTGKLELVFESPRDPAPPHCLIVLDEGSMVSPETVWPEYLERTQHLPGIRILVSADTGQLPPIVGRNYRGPPFIDPVARPAVQLTEIHRQARDNPIRQIAYAWRARQSPAFPRDDARARLWTDPKLCTAYGAARWMCSRLDAEKDATLITYYNETRQAINENCRRILGYDQAIEAIVPGDLLRIAKNNHALGVMNGEVVHVTKIQPLGEAPSAWLQQKKIDEGIMEDAFRAPPVLTDHRIYRVWVKELAQPLYIIPGLMEQSQGMFIRYCRAYGINGFLGRNGWPRLNLTHVTWGYCLTIHASQGSEWDEVGFYVEPRLQRYIHTNRWGPNAAYTAATRAKEALHVFWG